MNEVYVDQDAGNDANAGTKASPKATIQGGLNVLTLTTGLIHVRDGYYSESVTRAGYAASLRGYGRVTLDGGSACITSTFSSGTTITFDNIRFVSAGTGVSYNVTTTTGSAIDCIFDTVGVAFNMRPLYVHNCVFARSSMGCYAGAGNSSVTSRIFNNIFYKCNSSIAAYGGATTWNNIRNNIFVAADASSLAYDNTNQPISSMSSMDYNTFYGYTNIHQRSDGLYTLAQVQASFSIELNSVATDPGLADPENGLFGLVTGADALTSGAGGGRKGPIDLVYAASASVNPTFWAISSTPDAAQAGDGDGWYNAGDAGAIEYDVPSGSFVVASGADRRIRSPILHNGASTDFRNVRISADDPELVVVRIRVSDTTFEQNAAYPAVWYTIERNVLNGSAITGEHYQFEMEYL